MRIEKLHTRQGADQQQEQQRLPRHMSTSVTAQHLVQRQLYKTRTRSREGAASLAPFAIQRHLGAAPYQRLQFASTTAS